MQAEDASYMKWLMGNISNSAQSKVGSINFIGAEPIKEKTMEEKQKDIKKRDEIVNDLIGSGYWNGKIYGGKNKSIYVSGDKVNISDEEAKYLEMRKAFHKKFNSQIAQFEYRRILK